MEHAQIIIDNTIKLAVLIISFLWKIVLLVFIVCHIFVCLNYKVNVIYDNYRISLTILSFLIRKSVLFLKFPYQILSQKRKLPLRPCQWHTLFLYQQSDAIAYK